MFKWIAKMFGAKQSAKDRQAIKGKEIGKITHYYGHLNVGIIELSDALKTGDRIRVKGHTSDFTQEVASMQIEHANVAEGKRGDMVGIKVAEKVHPHDIVYKI